MNKHRGNSIKNVKKKLHSKTKQKNHGKVKLTNPTRLCLLGSAMNGNKNTNKKMMRIKSKTLTLTLTKMREKKAIEKRFFLFV